MALCDLLVRLALEDLYRPLWSRAILEETLRSLVRRFPSQDARRLERRVDLMDAALPGALVHDYEQHLPAVASLGDDAHVLAAAIAGGADVIVTSNTKDFPDSVLEPLGIAAVSPDEFLAEIWRPSAPTVMEVLVAQAEGTKRPPLSVADILRSLEHVAPDFVSLVRGSPEYAANITSESGD